MRAASRSTRRCLEFSAGLSLLPSPIYTLESAQFQGAYIDSHPVHSSRRRCKGAGTRLPLWERHGRPRRVVSPASSLHGHHADHLFLPFCDPACALSLYNDTLPCPHHGQIHSTWRDNCQFFPSLHRALGPSASLRSTIGFHARTAATTCIYGASDSSQMKFSITAAVLALATAVSAQTINTPTALYTCEPYQIVWSGGAPPYYLRVLEGGTTSNVRRSTRLPAARDFPISATDPMRPPFFAGHRDPRLGPGRHLVHLERQRRCWHLGHSRPDRLDRYLGLRRPGKLARRTFSSRVREADLRPLFAARRSPSRRARRLRASARLLPARRRPLPPARRRSPARLVVPPLRREWHFFLPLRVPFHRSGKLTPGPDVRCSSSAASSASSGASSAASSASGAASSAGSRASSAAQSATTAAASSTPSSGATKNVVSGLAGVAAVAALLV